MLANDKVKAGTNAAADVLDGVSDIIRQRSGTHGDAFENLSDIGRRWSNFINGKMARDGCDVTSLRLSAADVAYMMVEMKLSRATYGDDAELDHPMDIVGYAAIWAAFVKKMKEAAQLNKKANPVN